MKWPWGLSFMKTHMGVWVLFIGKNLPAIHFTGLSHIQVGVLSLKACSVTVVQLLIQAHFLGIISDYDNLDTQNRKCIHVALYMIPVPALFMVWPCCMHLVWFKTVFSLPNEHPDHDSTWFTPQTWHFFFG